MNKEKNIFSDVWLAVLLWKTKVTIYKIKFLSFYKSLVTESQIILSTYIVVQKGITLQIEIVLHFLHPFSDWICFSCGVSFSILVILRLLFDTLEIWTGTRRLICVLFWQCSSQSHTIYFQQLLMVSQYWKIIALLLNLVSCCNIEECFNWFSSIAIVWIL